MIITLIPILFVAICGYYGYSKFVAEKIDCPANNENIKGLEKSEIKAAIKEVETKKKELAKEIKDLENERKEALKNADEKEKAQEKLDEKNEKANELAELDKDLADLKAVDKGGAMAKVPNKLTWNNGIWLGGFVLALFFVYKLSAMLFRSLFRNIGFEE